MTTPSRCVGEAMALQDVVGERMQEHDGADLFNTANGQLPQVPIAPAGMDAFADRARLVLRLTGVARHTSSPSQHARSVAAPRQVGIGAMLGLGGRTIDLDPFVMRPLDILGAAKAAVGEMASRKMAGQRAQPLQHRPHEAAIEKSMKRTGLAVAGVAAATALLLALARKR